MGRGSDAEFFTGQSDFQKVEVYDTPQYGRMLFNDDLVMVSESDEFVYHDMITHVPLFTHPNPRKVLIIGGGDGGTAREVLRHQSVEKVEKQYIGDHHGHKNEHDIFKVEHTRIKYAFSGNFHHTTRKCSSD